MPSPPVSQRTSRASISQVQSGSNGVTQTSDETIMTDVADRNLAVQTDVVGAFLKRLVNCRSVAQLVSLVPAAVQDRTRVDLDNIVNAHVKKATTAFQLAEWRDSLAKQNYDGIPELKSIRGPSVQVSKLAETEAAISKDFSEALKEAKKSALTRMIEIKASEVEALTLISQEDRNVANLILGWKRVADTEGVSKEAHVLLYDSDSIRSLIQTAISIGENTAQKQMLKKQQKALAVKKTKTGATAVMPTEPKALEEFVKEIAKRQKQSAMDKSKARKPGKGQRGAGPSKTKNQKNAMRVAKNRKGKNAKRGTSSGKQQKKR